MHQLSEYQMDERISETGNFVLYRGFRDSDNLPVTIKLLRKTYPAIKDVARIKKEYEILGKLNIDGVIKSYGLIERQNTYGLIMADVEGDSIERILGARGISIDEFLQIAIRISEIIGEIHHHNVIHKNISPACIFWHSERKAVSVIDFGLSTTMSQETAAEASPSALEGHLAYISPEQTGRMNRVIDYRTDFYSLGVSFYEMLTRRLPFEANDMVELIHCHLARKPVPPQVLNPRIPDVVGNIVMTLMEKNAENRYQSASGLQTDLQQCMDLLNSKGRIESFRIRQKDSSNVFQISQKFYGRKKEIDLLLATFESAAGGRTAMMLVTGYSGIGKTSLIREIHKPIIEKKGFYISGKFDQFRRDIPYAALAQAFRELIRQILTESEAKVAEWREKIVLALGPNGRVISDVIPEIELIIGEQPEIPILPPDATQNRFNLVFQNFVRVFAAKEHPLIIVQDDLQWADLPSLKILEQIVLDADLKFTMIIGAYRSHEVGATHPLKTTLRSLAKSGIKISFIVLKPLDAENLNRLIADTLLHNYEKTCGLTELILGKTIGNPFYAKAYLKSLYEHNLLNYEKSTGQWLWDTHEIKKLRAADNVGDLLSLKLKNLPPAALNTLQWASCVGNKFDLRTVALAQGKPEEETVLELDEAIREGLILPAGEEYEYIAYVDGEKLKDMASGVSYTFAHDQVQGAAGRSIPHDRAPAYHFAIGRQMLSDARNSNLLDEKIIDIVNHLNRGISLMRGKDEKVELAELNLAAGRKATASAAFEIAYSYLKTGIIILGRDSWEMNYNLTLTMYEESAEAAYLCGDFDNLERLFRAIAQKARNVLDTIKIYEIKIMALMAELEVKKAVDTGLKALEHLGMHIPIKPSRSMNKRESNRILSILNSKRNNEIINLPKMTDPKKIAIYRLFNAISVPAAHMFPELSQMLSQKMAKLSLESGNSMFSAIGYAHYGSFTYLPIEDIKNANRMGDLAIELAEKLDLKGYKAKIAFLVFAAIKPWSLHLNECTAELRKNILLGKEMGDFDSVGRMVCFCSTFPVLTGEDLNNASQEAEAGSNFLSQHNFESFLQYNEFYRQIILNLLGESEAPFIVTGTAFNEEISLQKHLKSNDNNFIFLVYFFKMILYYLFHEYQKAEDCATNAQKYSSAISFLVFTSFLPFWDSLSRLALYDEKSESEKEDILKTISENQKITKKWALHCAENHLQKHYLIEAERFRVLGKKYKSGDYYDKAIELARKHGYLSDEALANELAGQFYLGIEKRQFAEVYLKNAHYLYHRWGAEAKVKDLEQRYPQFFERGLAHTASQNGTHLMSGRLDMESIVKATQTLSSEAAVGDLLKKMMQIVMENAGAQKGILLLRKEESWVIEAEGAADSPDIRVFQSIPIERAGAGGDSPIISLGIVNYVARTMTNVVLDDAAHEELFTEDAYVKLKHPKSVLCMPIIYRNKISGILYLENNLISGAFTAQKIDTLNLLSTQLAISIENALKYREVDYFNEMMDLITSYQDKIKAMAQSITNTKEREKRGIAVDVHAGIGQALALAKMKISELKELRKSDLDSDLIRDLNTLIENSIEYTKDIMFELSPPMLYEAGLLPALDWLLDKYRSKYNMKVMVEDHNFFAQLNGDNTIFIFRSIQELLMNVVKHARADEVELALSNDADHMNVTVKDNGSGFKRAIEKAISATGGFGLFSIKERVENMRGKFVIESETGKGTTVQFTIPLK